MTISAKNAAELSETSKDLHANILIATIDKEIDAACSRGERVVYICDKKYHKKVINHFERFGYTIRYLYAEYGEYYKIKW